MVPYESGEGVVAVRYFDHDSKAGVDDKIITLRIEHGGAAVDAYWTILEQIYDDEAPLEILGNQHKTKSVSHRLCVGSEQLEEWVKSMIDIGLLEVDESNPKAVTSRRAMENIERYHQKQETARQNGKKGGRKTKQKPSGNQSASDVGGGREANKTKTKGFGFDKQNQKPAGPDAAAAGAAPPLPSGWVRTGILCPRCKSHEVKKPDGELVCPKCDPVDFSMALAKGVA